MSIVFPKMLSANISWYNIRNGSVHKWNEGDKIDDNYCQNLYAFGVYCCLNEWKRKLLAQLLCFSLVLQMKSPLKTSAPEQETTKKTALDCSTWSKLIDKEVNLASGVLYPLANLITHSMLLSLLFHPSSASHFHRVRGKCQLVYTLWDEYNFNDHYYLREGTKILHPKSLFPSLLPSRTESGILN